jgi:hypothetical protein
MRYLDKSYIENVLSFAYITDVYFCSDSIATPNLACSDRPISIITHQHHRTNETITPPIIAQAFALTSFSALSFFAVAPASAVVINFESLAVNNGSINVDWGQGSPFHQFDNINVSAAGGVSGGVTAVPEPLTILGTIFGVGSGMAMKRKLAKATADKG